MTEALVIQSEEYHQYKEMLIWAWKMPEKDMAYITRLTDAINVYEAAKAAQV